MRGRINDAVSIDDLRLLARRRVPKMVFEAIDGAADDEVTLRRNRAAFERITLHPRPLVDVTRRDASTTVFGERIAMPVMFAPTGAGRLASPDAEIMLARAATAHGTIYVHSAVASRPLEDVAAAAAGPLWFQMYLPPDRGRAAELIARVQSAGYRALVLTVDTPVRGNRERDLHNRFEVPHRVTPRFVKQGLTRPAWSTRFVMTNLRGRAPASLSHASRPLSLREVEHELVKARWPATWDDLEFVRGRWEGPLLVKGVLRPDACARLVSAGVDGVVVSNHGGRQLDGSPATIDVLPAIVEAAAGRAEVFLDGGVRRGTDVLKAVALGARACLIGRPYLYGIAAGGEPGLRRVLDIMHTEIDRAMALLGAPRLCDVDRDLVSLPVSLAAAD